MPVSWTSGPLNVKHLAFRELHWTTQGPPLLSVRPGLRLGSTVSDQHFDAAALRLVVARLPDGPGLPDAAASRPTGSASTTTTGVATARPRQNPGATAQHVSIAPLYHRAITLLQTSAAVTTCSGAQSRRQPVQQLQRLSQRGYSPCSRPSWPYSSESTKGLCQRFRSPSLRQFTQL